MTSIVAMIILFGLLVFVHELGHFWMARRKGVKVEEFAFGFPPRLWSRKKGDTKYSINLIPLGGFVKLFGEHDEHKEDPKSYASKSKGKKAQILVAGVIMNFLLAVFLLTIGYTVGMKSLIPGMEDHYGVVNTQQVVINNIEEGTPAESSGLVKGDIIQKVEGQEVNTEIEVLSLVTEKANADLDAKVEMEVLRGEETITSEIQTFEDTIESRGEEIKVRRIGVGIEGEGNIKSPIYLAPVAAVSETVRLTGLTFVGIVDVFKQFIVEQSVSDGVAGPVGIASLAGTFAEAGVIPFLQFAAILSIALAILNILPIPVLDGGHLLVLGIEKILGRDLSPKAKSLAMMGGLAFLVVFIVAVTIRDIGRLV